MVQKQIKSEFQPNTTIDSRQYGGLDPADEVCRKVSSAKQTNTNLCK
jgi:hypothetical protein